MLYETVPKFHSLLGENKGMKKQGFSLGYL